MIKRETYAAYYNAVEAGGGSVAEAVEWFVNSFRSGELKYSQRACESIYKRLVEFYGRACAQAALEFYQTMRTQANVLDEYVPEYFQETFNTAPQVFAKAEQTADPAKYMAQYASRWVRQQGANTIVRNAAADPAKPKCMRIAQPTACGYCRMLASLGAWYATKQTAANANVHENCHCAIAVEFSDDPALEGYSPKVYRTQYKRAWEQTGTTKRAAIIAQMDKNAGRNHNSADYYQRVTKPKREAEKAAKAKG